MSPVDTRTAPSSVCTRTRACPLTVYVLATSSARTAVAPTSNTAPATRGREVFVIQFIATLLRNQPPQLPDVTQPTAKMFPLYPPSPWPLSGVGLSYLVIHPDRSAAFFAARSAGIVATSVLTSVAPRAQPSTFKFLTSSLLLPQRPQKLLHRKRINYVLLFQ